MDPTKKLVSDHLAHRGFADVVYEPDGKIPPDSLVDGAIAIEVRRLNQNHFDGFVAKRLEEVAIPLWNQIKLATKADVHVLVEGGLDLNAVHAITEAIEKAVQQKLPTIDLIVHPEPDAPVFRPKELQPNSEAPPAPTSSSKEE